MATPEWVRGSSIEKTKKKMIVLVRYNLNQLSIKIVYIRFGYLTIDLVPTRAWRLRERGRVEALMKYPSSLSTNQTDIERKHPPRC
mmetsp:Transcript_11581/g.23543  ORF Transcript_11581/g.23543 Transcript_11581/m.23543 type:complete len:86 (-) Transcript_11581:3582-3839(-)